MVNAVRKNVTLSDIAAEAGVSPVTVSKALLGTGGNNTQVSAARVEEIRRIAEKLNYQPNLIARQLKGASSQLVGVIIDSYAPEINFNWLSAMERETTRQGYRFIVGQSHGELKTIQAYVNDFSGRGVEGVICISHNYSSKWVSSRIIDLFDKLPHVVFVGAPVKNQRSHHWVEIDTAAGIRQAIEHLLSRGRSRIGLLLLKSESRPMVHRYQSYVRTLKKNGIDLNPELVRTVAPPGKLDPKKMEPHIRELTDKHRVDGIIAADDKIAFITINILRELGLKVPDEIAVIGYDNIEMAQYFHPALTTVDQQNSELSRSVVDMLFRMIENKPLKTRKHLITPRLIIRESA